MSRNESALDSKRLAPRSFPPISGRRNIANGPAIISFSGFEKIALIRGRTTLCLRLANNEAKTPGSVPSRSTRATEPVASADHNYE
ncbi:unnamed protein product [Leptosia nina]|uniref:Uncharacterized protein n=1 Tax=Leptosia nina TaxID=320188 RepID=A0AAV1JH68_9NEOP